MFQMIMRIFALSQVHDCVKVWLRRFHSLWLGYFGYKLGVNWCHILSDMHSHNVWPGQEFAGQKLKFTRQLSDDWLSFAGLSMVVEVNKLQKNHVKTVWD